MSSCLRSVPNKFTCFVTSRRQITNIEHQLTKHVKSSPFSEEFVGLHTGKSWAINTREKITNSVVPLLSNNILCSYYEPNIRRSKLSKNGCDGNEQGEVEIESGNVINSSPVSINVLKNNETIHCKKEQVLYTETSPNVRNLNEEQASEGRKPSDSQLQNVFDILSRDLPLLFVKQLEYDIYTKDLVFVNNIKGTSTVGIEHYVKQIAFLKIIGHIKYAYVKLDILKMTMHPEDNSIKVRWRIIGISGTRIFLTFWRFSSKTVKEQAENKSAWYDGFSTFYVNNDGKIFKHVVDKMIPNQDTEEKVKTPLETKLALCSALLSLDSYYPTSFCLKKYSQSH